MLSFILRRIAVSLLVLWAGSVLLYVLTINSGDPLSDLRESNRPNRDELMAARTKTMNLDQPWFIRYFAWFTGVSKCVVLQCDLGLDRTGSNVNTAVVAAMGSSLRLVTLATALAIVLGVTMGLLSAIRQYSGFDYAVTFAAFLFFSLPVFWAAVLLKQYGAIGFNNWMADPSISTVTTLVIALLFGATVSTIAGGDLRRRLITFGASAVLLFAVVSYFDAIGWWRRPALGLPLVLLLSLAALGLLLMLTVGLRNRRVIYCGLAVLGVGSVLYFVLAPLLADPTWGVILLLLLGAVVLGVVIGVALGGYERRTALIVSIGTSVAFAGFVFVDRLLSSWGAFLEIKGRPIGTIGSSSPGFEGNFWESIWNWGVQLILPTIVLTVISLASYSRYTRSSMLETTQQDYIRTARSKGLSDRVVNTRHALRNALIPITTIVAFDFASLIGGAVVTERVFGWTGMGALFQSGLNDVDPNPVMGFYLVTATAAVLMNMFADIAYASLDPRIRR